MLRKPKFSQNFVATPFFGGSFFLMLHMAKFGQDVVPTSFLRGFFFLCYTSQVGPKFILKQSLKEIHSFAPSFNNMLTQEARRGTSTSFD
jgi:hypothetical protein